MNEKLQEELTKLAGKLNVGVDVLWAALLKQAAIDGVVTIIQIVIMAVITYLLMKKGRAAFKHAWDDGDNPFVVVLWIVGTFAMGALWITAFCYLQTLAAAFMNPEYWALHKLTGK